MKKFISTILALSMSLTQILGLCVNAEGEQLLCNYSISGISYSLYDDKNLVIDYNGTTSLWFSLNQLNFNGTYSYNNGDIISVEFSDNVTAIPENALRDCTLIRNITLPDNLTSIGDYAFANTGIKNIVLPTSIQHMGPNFISGCVTNVTLASNISVAQPAPSQAPETTATTQLSQSPESTETTLPTQSPESTETTEPTQSPEPSATTEPTQSPEPSSTTEPTPSEVPVPSETPLPDGTYRITYSLNGGIIASDAPTTYTAEDTITLKTPTREGYRFYKWYSDSSYTKTIENIPAGSTGDIVVYATWIKKSSGGSLGTSNYTIQFNSKGGSSVDSQKVAKGSYVTKPEAPTKRGHIFAGWYSDSKLRSKYNFNTPVLASFILYAKWISTDDADAPHYDYDYDDEDTNNSSNDIVIDNEYSATTIILTIDSRIIVLNGKKVENDVAPMIRNNRTMMPIRFIAEALDADVTWDPQFRIVTISDDFRHIVIHIDSDRAYLNGDLYELDSPAFISENRTYVPIRFVAEALDCEVEWSVDARTVTISR